MLTVLIMLSALGLVALLAGFVIVLVSKGNTTYRSGEEVGIEVMEDHLDDGLEKPVAQKSLFKGQARSVEREASISFSEIKAEIRSRNWSQALPLLLAVGGFLGLLLFGSLALFLIIDSKLVGGLMVVLIIITVLRIVYQMIKA